MVNLFDKTPHDHLFMPMFQVIFILLVVAFFIWARKLPGASSPPRILDNYYYVFESIMSPAELSFCKTLEDAIPPSCEIHAKIRLVDLFGIKNLSLRERYAALNRLGYKHVDFLIVSKDSKRPLLAIELDDKTHKNNKRTIKRDLFVNQLYKDLEFPLYRQPVKTSYAVGALQDAIGRYLRK